MRNLILPLLLIIGLVACNEEKNPDQSNPTTTKKQSSGAFTCQLNETPFNAGETFAEVFYNDQEGVDSIVITAIHSEVTLKSYIYLFDGVGDYPFKNNEEGEGIARGELIEKGKIVKNFFSTNGAVYVSYFNAEKEIVSGTFEGEFFYKGEAMPEIYEAKMGSFNNLKVQKK